MIKWLDRLLSDVNGAPCPARLLWVLSVLVGLTLQVLAVVRGQYFNFDLFGLGAAAVLAGGGFGVRMKAWADKRS